MELGLPHTESAVQKADLKSPQARQHARSNSNLMGAPKAASHIAGHDASLLVDPEFITEFEDESDWRASLKLCKDRSMMPGQDNGACKACAGKHRGHTCGRIMARGQPRKAAFDPEEKYTKKTINWNSEDGLAPTLSAGCGRKGAQIKHRLLSGFSSAKGGTSLNSDYQSLKSLCLPDTRAAEANITATPLATAVDAENHVAAVKAPCFRSYDNGGAVDVLYDGTWFACHVVGEVPAGLKVVFDADMSSIVVPSAIVATSVRNIQEPAQVAATRTIGTSADSSGTVVNAASDLASSSTITLIIRRPRDRRGATTWPRPKSMR